MNRAELKSKAKQALGKNLTSENWLYALLACAIVAIISSALTFTGIGTIIVMGPLSFGLSYCFLKQARDSKKMDIAELFNGFKEDLGGNIILGLIRDIFVSLWLLLLIIPGIIKYYAYSMAFYIKNDHPDYDWKKCLDESQKLTNGHKMDLFILDLSFIGWVIVCSFTFGIGALWLAPYIAATKTEAYLSFKSEAAIEA